MPESMHLIADLVCSKGLDDVGTVQSFMESVIAITDLHIEHFHVQEFSNGSEFGPGITGMALLSESHMVVHTAPDRQSLNIDLFSCRPFRPFCVQEEVERHFGVPVCKRWDLISR